MRLRTIARLVGMLLLIDRRLRPIVRRRHLWRHLRSRVRSWIKVLRQSRDLGAAQLGISGGEPLLRKDIEEIVTEASSLGYYSNLITSGAGMNEKRIDALKDGGLDHIQLSMHDITEEINNFITNT